MGSVTKYEGVHGNGFGGNNEALRTSIVGSIRKCLPMRAPEILNVNSDCNGEEYNYCDNYKLYGDADSGGDGKSIEPDGMARADPIFHHVDMPNDMESVPDIVPPNPATHIPPSPATHAAVAFVVSMHGSFGPAELHEVCLNYGKVRRMYSYRTPISKGFVSFVEFEELEVMRRIFDLNGKKFCGTSWVDVQKVNFDEAIDKAEVFFDLSQPGSQGFQELAQFRWRDLEK